MKTYVILIRGINVGGKNKVPMTGLKKSLEEAGFDKVATYLSSGNVILDSDQTAEKTKNEIEKALVENFKLDDELIKVLVLTRQKFEAVIDDKPKGFGEEPDKYYSDAIFLMDIETDKALKVFDVKEGVDKIWPGEGVVYWQRLTSQRTKSHMSKVFADPAYKSMTIRSWSTTLKLLDKLKKTQTE